MKDDHGYKRAPTPEERRQVNPGGYTYTETTPVLSRRDVFAALAMAGMYAAQVHGLDADHAVRFSTIAVEAADALLARLDKGATDGEAFRH